jgi:GntR family transcriptional regulator / MocR family aminotransferase
MPKRAILIDRPAIALDARLAQPLYKQLYERLRTTILEGQLERGARLPSTRTLASELGISRTTVALAYEQLLLEGYLESRVGQGTIVARQLPIMLLKQHLEQSAPPGDLPLQGAARARQLAADLPIDRESASAIFRIGEPAIDRFPYPTWARLVARAARHGLHSLARYQSPAGYEPLREAIAAHIGITRGVRCAPEQIIITAGSQGAIDLAVRTLLGPGEAAWVESPGYFGTRGSLRAAGARIIPVPVDAQGIDVAAGRERAPQARIAAITPSHQFPTGVTMSLTRRLALLEWAEQAGAWILEDDYDSEYRFGGRPLDALQGLDHAGRVLYVGSFSKVMFPALRLGYLVAPSDLVAPLLAMRRVIDVHAPMLEQLALADFLTEGHFVRHLRQMLQCYRARRDRLHHELRQHLGDLIEVQLPEAGMHLVGWLPPGVDDQRASALAAQHDISVIPISRYSLEPLARGGLLFGYASTSEADITLGVRRLAGALRHIHPG